MGVKAGGRPRGDVLQSELDDAIFAARFDLIGEIRHPAERPTLEELRARLHRRAATGLVESPAQAVRAGPSGAGGTGLTFPRRRPHQIDSGASVFTSFITKNVRTWRTPGMAMMRSLCRRLNAARSRTRMRRK